MLEKVSGLKTQSRKIEAMPSRVMEGSEKYLLSAARSLKTPQEIAQFLKDMHGKGTALFAKAVRILQSVHGNRMVAEEMKFLPVSEKLSGAAWFHRNQAKYPNSDNLNDLESEFRQNVQNFKNALEEAGAEVTISSTRRNADRAFLMHYSWKLAHGEIKPDAIPKDKSAEIGIEWDHGDLEKSKKAAKEMVACFGMKHRAALTSNHIQGKAVDMNIQWSGTLKVETQDGTAVAISSTPRNGQNPEIHKVGKTYGVIKLASDPPHWSYNGH